MFEILVAQYVLLILFLDIACLIFYLHIMYCLISFPDWEGICLNFLLHNMYCLLLFPDTKVTLDILVSYFLILIPEVRIDFLLAQFVLLGFITEIMIDFFSCTICIA
jgi:hypothetical protein